jgi:hypothetical protein
MGRKFAAAWQFDLTLGRSTHANLTTFVSSHPTADIAVHSVENPTVVLIFHGQRQRKSCHQRVKLACFNALPCLEQLVRIMRIPI